MFLQLFFFQVHLRLPTNPKNTGVFAIGFIIAKNPVKTVKAKRNKFSFISPRYLNYYLKKIPRPSVKQNKINMIQIIKLNVVLLSVLKYVDSC